MRMRRGELDLHRGIPKRRQFCSQVFPFARDTFHEAVGEEPHGQGNQNQGTKYHRQLAGNSESHESLDMSEVSSLMVWGLD